jgi:hypothetical protein
MLHQSSLDSPRVSLLVNATWLSIRILHSCRGRRVVVALRDSIARLLVVDSDAIQSPDPDQCMKLVPKGIRM